MRKKAYLYLIISMLIGGLFLPLRAQETSLQENAENYKDLISRKICSALTSLYPQEAKEKKWEGIAKVKFIIKKDGSVEDAKIKESSGYPLLDRAALWAVESASPYPFPFNDKENIPVELPISFGSLKNNQKENQSPPSMPTPKEYQQALLEKISFFLAYPSEIREKEVKNTVKVNFLVKKDGSVENLKIKESSNSSALDEAGLSAVKNAAPLPSPLNIGKEEEEITLTLGFTKPIKLLKPAVSCIPLLAERNPVPASLSRGISGTQSCTWVLSRGIKESPLTAKPLIEKRKSMLGEPIAHKVIVQGKQETTEIGKTDLKKSLGPNALDTEYKEKTSMGAGLRDAIMPTKPEQTGIKGRLEMSDVYSESLPLELKGFIETAIDNYQPLQIAKEEVTLAQIKIREAARNLFPALKVQAYTTEGDVYKVQYEEKELKVNLDQPLYYGGRLRDAYEQAKVNLEITKRNYDQRVLDTIHKTEVAYYTLITLRMNLEKQNEILAEAKKILDVTEKQYKRGVIIPLEFSNVTSWYERLMLLRDSIIQELDLAYLTFKQVLNTEASPSVNLFSLDVREFDIGLEDCVNESLEMRPEINLAKLSVVFYKYNKKMEDAKDKFNVDFTGNYGWYQGHYLTEEWKSSKNWYYGIKVTKPIGASTSTVTYSKEETQPRHGQTSATASQTINAELGVLDSFKKVSEKKDAKIALLNAENKLDETEKNIIFEAQDAFYKHQKSLIELKSALTQKNFRENEIRINKIKVYRGEGSFPDLIQTLLNLSDAENTYLRALGNYYISLATLRKATGYGLKI